MVSTHVFSSYVGGSAFSPGRPNIGDCRHLPGQTRNYRECIQIRLVDNISDSWNLLAHLRDVWIGRRGSVVTCAVRQVFKSLGLAGCSGDHRCDTSTRLPADSMVIA